jgi:outer membrane protein
VNRFGLSAGLVLLVTLMGPALYSEDAVVVITNAQAHAMALKNAPRITLARLEAMEAQEQVVMARSAWLPNINLAANAVRADSAVTRIGAGGLNNPSVYDRDAVGLAATQLITDFGRTPDLIAAAHLHAQAADREAQAAIDEVLYEVDLMYYRTLQGQFRLVVAEQTVKDRQLMVDRISGLVKNQLKSDLDLGFAQVNLDQGNMLLEDVRNQLQTDRLALAALLGYDAPQPFQVVDEPVPAVPADTEIEALVVDALSHNPRISRLRLEIAAAKRTRDAESALDYPTVSAIGVAGRIVNHDPRLPDAYAAWGLSLTIPLYSGGMIASREHQADLREQIAEMALKATENDLSRDVRVAVADVRYASERLDLVGKLLAEVSKTMDLAQTKFNLGLISVVDLSQAELNRTDAAMTASAAKQDLLLKLATLNHDLGRWQVPPSDRP